MSIKSGKVSVTTENIFPVIRQWLYSDQDIFIREFVSNCADAVAKHKRLVDLGKASNDNSEYRITVTFDDDNKTISFEDNGIGMSADEVDKYINQIAFSGAMDFVTKYQEQSTDKAGIIGHFGLGSKKYTHETSPIRRFSDLLLHYMIKIVLFKPKIIILIVIF